MAKSKFSQYIWIYISFIILIILSIFVFGFAGPFLIGVSDSFLVCVGFVLVILYPILVGIWFKKFLYPQFKKISE